MKNLCNQYLQVAFLTAVFGCAISAAQSRPTASDTTPTIVSEEFTVEHDGIKMIVRRKQLPNALAQSKNTLVLLPSATFSCSPNWDLQHNDSSLMDFLAGKGWVIYTIDLPGYGKSDNPHKPETFGAVECEPFIDSAMDFICGQHQIESVNLLGWSWGAQVAGRYANTHPKRVNKLVLYGFTYKNRLPAAVLPKDPFRKLELDGARADFIPGCFEDGVPEQYAQAVLKSDDDRLAPSGPLNDYVNRLPIVDPAVLKMPVLVLSGQYEVEQPPNIDGDFKDFFQSRRQDQEAFCRELPGGKNELVVITGGGHAVHLEKPKHEWRQKVLEFFSGD